MPITYVQLREKTGNCAYGQLVNLMSARPVFRAMSSGVSSSSETTSRFLLRFPGAFRSARS